MRMDNKNKLVFGYLNIEVLFAISSDHWVDVIMIYETKVDYSFHIGNFLINDLVLHSVQIVTPKVEVLCCS